MLSKFILLAGPLFQTVLADEAPPQRLLVTSAPDGDRALSKRDLRDLVEFLANLK